MNRIKVYSWICFIISGVGGLVLTALLKVSPNPYWGYLYAITVAIVILIGSFMICIVLRLDESNRKFWLPIIGVAGLFFFIAIANTYPEIYAHPFPIIPIFAIIGYVIGKSVGAWAENKWQERQRLAEEQRRKEEARLEAEHREQARRENERRKAEEERRRREEEKRRRLEGMKQEILEKIEEVTSEER